MTEAEELYVKSHVSRDLLQSAALFKNDHLVVWEYVSNGLQYVDPGTVPRVRVTLDDRRKRIAIKDNGRGMTFADLQDFFVMHGENVDRKIGRPGRGMFGTGKSAAFGIAERLIISTTRNGMRTRVSLSRDDINGMRDNSPIPVQVLERTENSEEANGTLVEIEGVHLRKLDQKNVIRFVERHLAHWPRNVVVWINNHECQYVPPAALRLDVIHPSGEIAEILGPCKLNLRVSAVPLGADEAGVAVFSKGVWYETTLAGSEGREMASFIFGDIDIPRIDEDDSPIAPFDMSRAMHLNAANPLVQTAYAFIGTSVEKLRRELVAEERRRRASEEAQKLAMQGSEIARVINEDFREFQQRVAKARARARGGDDLGVTELDGGGEAADLVFGRDEGAVILDDHGSPGAEGSGGGGAGGEPRTLNPEVEAGTDADPKLGQRSGSDGGGRAKPRGGFSIEFRHMGQDQDRAKYQREARQIVINLDHPQLHAALGSGSVEDPVFRRLAYEVAFSEYALALALELALRDEYVDITDPIVEIGETLNRVARRGASLYEEPST